MPSASMRQHERLIVAAGGLGLVLLWEMLVRRGVLDASLAPAPSTILDALLKLVRRPEVVTSLGVTAWEVLGAFVIAAILTPPDVLSQLSLALPLLALYEGSVWSVRFVEKKAAAAAAAPKPNPAE